MKKVWDRIGIAFSSACVLHCLLVAFVPIVFPAISQYTHATWIHVVVGFIILFTSPLAFVPGYRKHGLTWILKTAVLGLFLVFAGIILEGTVTDKTSHSISILGSLLLVFAHAKNLIHAHRHQHQPCC
jgi:hypothetical protein